QKELERIRQFIDTYSPFIGNRLMPAYATGVVGTRGVRLAEEQIYRISGGKVSVGVGGTGKKASGAGNPIPHIGVVQSRINLAEGPTRFSPSKNAGMEHIRNRHFNPKKNAGFFTISENELKKILQLKSTINSSVKKLESGAYERTIDAGKIVGNIKGSIPKVGGQPTQWINIITDKGGNIVTAYPVPKP
ncbi:hypothetical protein H1Z61_14065, partial [Bacillus aquiflavi]|nr:hypothetical protein [Bacillus aquiflavi]NEY82548.1 hypothetical protein [Bacillus aquiflavi]